MSDCKWFPKRFLSCSEKRPGRGERCWKCHATQCTYNKVVCALWVRFKSASENSFFVATWSSLTLCSLHWRAHKGRNSSVCRLCTTKLCCHYFCSNMVRWLCEYKILADILDSPAKRVRLFSHKDVSIDMVSILQFTLNLTVGEYRRSDRTPSVSILRDDVAMVMTLFGPRVMHVLYMYLFLKFLSWHLKKKIWREKITWILSAAVSCRVFFSTRIGMESASAQANQDDHRG